MGIKPKRSIKDRGYRLFRLVSGEYIIAKIVGSTKSKFFLDRPMTITGFSAMDNVGDFGLIKKQYMCLNNWMEYSLENTIDLGKDFVMVIIKPEQKMIDAYKLQKEIEDRDYIKEENENASYESLQISEILNEDEFSSLVERIIEDIKSEEFEWEQSDLDFDHPDFGNRINDWSPYTEDYFGGDGSTS